MPERRGHAGAHRPQLIVPTADSPGRLPRLVIAAPASGHGKTTVAIGLMAALRDRGLQVAPAKVGPDYIDPGYHAVATGRLGRNLDPFLCDPDLMVPLLWHAALTPVPADVAVIEGVMGLYDGRLGTAGFASTAHIATLTDSPVLLVVDARHTSRSVGAVVHGMATYQMATDQPQLRVAGVILNQVASARHRDEARAAIEAIGIPVVGSLPRDAGIHAPSRHLGLVPAAERPEARAALQRLAEIVAEHVDLDGVLVVADQAAELTGAPWDPAAAVAAASVTGSSVAGSATTGSGDDSLATSGARPVVAIAGGRAFTFRYPETDELLRAAGCEPVIFDPLTDTDLPAGTSALYLGGGFPQVYARELATNDALREQVRQAVTAGMPVAAECAGLLYLAESLDGAPMVGVLPAPGAMTPRLTMGYRQLSTPGDTLLAGAGESARGHEFHRTALARPAPQPAWLIEDHPEGWSLDPAGTGRASVHASYVHLHWAGFPQAARRFAEAAHRYAAAPSRMAAPPLPRPAPSSPAPPEATPPPEQLDLRHHGDQDLQADTVDLAVNIRGRPPAWLREQLMNSITAYPDGRAAARAIAARHGVGEDMVLATAGAAEAFTLIARALDASSPVVVHPQFTEPEAALRVAGHDPARHVLTSAHGFRLVPSAFEAHHDRADLVMVGNPTNPTSVLHPAATLRALQRPGRILVVDEAFLDLVPGEPETLIGPRMPGLLVIRSLTKAWGVAGLRAGYVVGDPALVAALAAHQPPWPVSTPALTVIEAALSTRGVEHTQRLAQQTSADRDDLVARLQELGLPTVGPARGPFVLVDTARCGAASIRQALAARGFAVRRGETFPGLSPAWIRVAVRDPAIHASFAAALADVIAQSDPRPPVPSGERSPRPC